MANIKEAFEYASKNPNSEFAKNLEKLASSGSLDSEARKYGIDLTPFRPEKGILSKLKERASNVAKAGKDIVNAQGVVETVAQAGRLPLRALGQTAGAVGDVIGETVVNPVLEATGADKVIQKGVQTVMDTKAGQLAQKGVEAIPEEIRESIGDTFNVAGAVTGTRALSSGVKAGAGATKNVVKKGSEGLSSVAESGAEVAQGLRTVLEPVSESLQNIPKNIKANIAQKAKENEIINALPTPAQQAVARSGVDVADINRVSAVKPEILPEVKNLVQNAEDFMLGVTSKDPIEVVGKPIVQRLKQLEKEKQNVGKLLAEESKNLGVVEVPELVDSVFNRIKSIPSLKDVRVVKTNTGYDLDFTNTSLASSFTKADRATISNAFKQSIRWGNGEKAHKFRQELFEVLGGKKKSLSNITDTQEKALEAIRQGLADVLETKNPNYKKLSKQYAQITEPIKELRKLNRSLDVNSDVDVLDLSAGLLARRLTSAAPSNPQLRTLLKKLDNAGITKGSSMSSTEDLLDIYNIVAKYYDIAPKTGFKGQIEGGVRMGLSNLTDKVSELTGYSPSTRQKAFRELLDSLE